MGDTMADSVIEKRKAPRRREETLVRFEGAGFSIYSRATDVSERGAFVATCYLLDPGTPIRVSLIDPSGTEEEFPARVIRTVQGSESRGEATIGFGVEFL
jgi:hypothetical protein